VLGFAIAAAVFTGCLFGLAPAWRSTRVDPHAVIKANTRSIVRGDSRFGLAKALVSAQMALSLVLIVAATLLLGTFRRLSSTEKGFAPGQVLVASVNLRRADLKPEQRKAAFRDLLEQTRALPGVRSASTSEVTPLSGGTWNETIEVAGFVPKSEQDALVWMNRVSDGYFATLSTALLQGRDFNERDLPNGSSVAIITESFARKFFGSERAVGKSFRMEVGEEKRPVEIIGVVQDAKYNSLREPMQSVGFVAMAQSAEARNSLNFEIALKGNPRAIIPRFTEMVTQMNSRASVSYTTLAQQVDETITRERLLATLSGFFGVLALLLATIGLYGVISYTMARRRNEIGIRIALGSARGRILRMVMSEVALVVVLGLVGGTALALASTRLVATLLYGVTPSDPATIVGSAAVLAAAALVAGFIPAARAARLDPTIALRDD
jgi:predicted permease